MLVLVLGLVPLLVLVLLLALFVRLMPLGLLLERLLLLSLWALLRQEVLLGRLKEVMKRVSMDFLWVLDEVLLWVRGLGLVSVVMFFILPNLQVLRLE